MIKGIAAVIRPVEIRAIVEFQMNARLNEPLESHRAFNSTCMPPMGNERRGIYLESRASATGVPIREASERHDRVDGK